MSGDRGTLIGIALGEILLNLAPGWEGRANGRWFLNTTAARSIAPTSDTQDPAGAHDFMHSALLRVLLIGGQPFADRAMSNC